MTRRLVVTLLTLAGAAFVIQGSWIQAKAALAQVLLQRAWADTLADGGEHRPWPWADFWPIARLQVARLDIDLVVLAGDSGNVLAFGPGHNPRSGLPGSSGTVVVSGHRDTHFRFLKNLRADDAVVLTAPQGTAVYQVQHTTTVDSRTTRLHIDPTARQLLLTTCYPFDALAAGGPVRYVVTAAL